MPDDTIQATALYPSEAEIGWAIPVKLRWPKDAPELRCQDRAFRACASAYSRCPH